MARSIFHHKLLTCALVLTPIFAGVGCGDDNGGDDDNGLDGGRPDGGPSNNIDGSRPDGSVTPDGQVILPDGAVAVVGDTWGFTSAGRLLKFERSTGKIEKAVTVTVPTGETVWGVDVRPADGAVIALTSAGKLYTVDTTTGATTLKSTLAADPADTTAPLFTALAGTAYGVDFNPVVDRLRVVSNTGQNLRINVDTGAVTADSDLNPANTGITAAAYTNSFKETCRTGLYVVDATARKLFLQDPPNDGKLVDVGSLGDTAIGEVHGFDIVTNSNGDNLALISATAADGERVSELNLQTGALSNPHVVALNSGEKLDSVFGNLPTTAPTQPLGDLLATTVSNKLISFTRTTPTKLCSSVAVTGLGAGENIVGTDVRPADGALYALSSTGKLYTVVPATGVATLKSTLSAATGDAFTALAGTEFGVGFNPVPDRLRVISDSGQNLRINVDDGKVTTDSAITQAAGTPGITALGYTNAFAGAKSTALWGIDSTSDSLVQVGANPATGATCPNATNPNCGVSTVVQPLGITGDVSAVNGFDINPTNNVVYAALVAGDAVGSTLYTINPTGPSLEPALPVASAVGVIAGGERVRSLTLAATPKLTAWAVTSDNKLLSFAPSAPQTSLTNAAITGLQTGEKLSGIDLRPADGKLYGVGTTGRLYALAADGKATEVVALSAAAGSAFTALPASTYGFDFNPAADALRLVNRAADNFRVLPSTRATGNAGATFVDSALNPAGPAIVAAAYTQSFVPLRANSTTTLYVISAGSSTLYLQGGLNGTPSPNLGTLTSVGALGVGSDFDIGFDITGGSNGLALAVLDQAGAPTLYWVNLGTGVATAYNMANNTIANAPGVIAGLALELK